MGERIKRRLGAFDEYRIIPNLASEGWGLNQG